MYISVVYLVQMIFADALKINYVRRVLTKGKIRAVPCDVRVAFALRPRFDYSCLCYGNCKALIQLYIRNPLIKCPDKGAIARDTESSTCRHEDL